MQGNLFYFIYYYIINFDSMISLVASILFQRPDLAPLLLIDRNINNIDNINNKSINYERDDDHSPADHASDADGSDNVVEREVPIHLNPPLSFFSLCK